MGSLMHFFYLFVFIFYVAGACLREYSEHDNNVYLEILLLVGILYPVIYESIQASKMGMMKYLLSPQNHAD